MQLQALARWLEAGRWANFRRSQPDAPVRMPLLSLADADLAYHAEGAGPPLLPLHGLGANGRRALGHRRSPGHHPDRRAYVATLDAIVGWTVLDRIAAITLPTLVVSADQDYTPVAAKEAYVHRVPNARLVVVEDSRHALPIERPDAFNAVLASFLDEVARNAPARP